MEKRNTGLRALSSNFFDEFKQENGKYRQLIEALHLLSQFMFCLRKDKVIIYYKCDKVVYCTGKCYYYCQRPNSIMAKSMRAFRKSQRFFSNIQSHEVLVHGFVFELRIYNAEFKVIEG